MEIRKAKENELKDIIRVLNATAKDMLEKGVNQWEYPWEEKAVEEQLGFLYAVSVDGTVVGTFGIKDVGDWHVGDSGKYLYQLALDQKYQGEGYGSAILSWACQYVRGSGEKLYLDCWAGNEKLRSFYSANGFDYVGDFPEEDYYISIFKCKQDCEDGSHFMKEASENAPWRICKRTLP